MKFVYLFAVMVVFVTIHSKADPRVLVGDFSDGNNTALVEVKSCKQPLVPCKAAVGGGAAGSKIVYKWICVSTEDSKKVNCGKKLPQ